VSAAAPSMGSRPRVLHSAFTPEEMEEFRDLNDSFDIYSFGQPRLCSADDLVIFLQLEGVDLERKVQALLAQASQTTGIVEAIGRERYAAWVSREGFADPE
jgi:hypothetical protein